jgi:hypothetical protein
VSQPISPKPSARRNLLRGQPIDLLGEERLELTGGNECLVFSPACRRPHTRAATRARATATTGAERESRQARQVCGKPSDKVKARLCNEQIREGPLEGQCLPELSCEAKARRQSDGTGHVSTQVNGRVLRRQRVGGTIVRFCCLEPLAPACVVVPGPLWSPRQRSGCLGRNQKEPRRRLKRSRPGTNPGPFVFCPTDRCPLRP